jgi:hypothetical protein
MSDDDDDDSLVEVYAAGDEITANLVKIALEEAGVDALVNHADLGTIRGTGVSGAAHARVLVAAAAEDRARDVVEEWLQSQADD